MQEKKEPWKITVVGALWLVVAAVIISGLVCWEMGKDNGYDAGFSAGQSDLQEQLTTTRRVSYDRGYAAGYEEGMSDAGNTSNHGTFTDSNTGEVLAGGSDEQTSNEQSQTVYITNTGEKYHRAGCQYLRQSQIAISLDDAINQGYTACSRCW